MSADGEAGGAAPDRAGAALGLDAGWSYDDERLWEDWGQFGEVKAVDGWYGFVNVEELVVAVKRELESGGA